MRNKLTIIKLFFKFLNEKRVYWLYPIVIVLILIGVIVILGEGSVLAPFIYSLF
ncbi:MAG: DUF5989 family protein [Flavobacteriales bacterium]|nr:DUF5989 family protein [Flavobacteriales bacterium]